MTATLHVLRVFVDDDGAHGNALGVFLDGLAIEPDARLAVAARLGFSETVFVDDARSGRTRIYTPGRELAFAGHPTVGTAWLLADVGMPVQELRVPAGIVPTWTEGDRRWVRARPEWIHPISLAEMPSAAAVEALEGPPDNEPSWYAWAWQAGRPGAIRSRYFAGAVGIAEDEATGAAAVLITAQLGRGLEILQGRGSRLTTRLTADGSVELGGRVVLDETRPDG
jgi:predicted PhzF superfamily epimerase YddE/YHI9